MIKQKEIILSGIGGQGLILSGTLLGEAATIHEGKNATLTSTYGVETRGTFTKSDIIISDSEIYFPEVINPDIILAIAQVAYDKYATTVDENTVLIYDNGLVKSTEECNGQQFGYSITEIARELGNEKSANIIALGIIIGKTGVLKKESVIEALKKQFFGKEKVIDLNVKALEKGIKLSEEIG